MHWFNSIHSPQLCSSIPASRQPTLPLLRLAEGLSISRHCQISTDTVLFSDCSILHLLTVYVCSVCMARVWLCSYVCSVFFFVFLYALVVHHAHDCHVCIFVHCEAVGCTMLTCMWSSARGKQSTLIAPCITLCRNAYVFLCPLI